MGGGQKFFALKVLGPADPCGGPCAPGTSCSPQGACEPCAALACGGTCGDCQAGMLCVAGTCEVCLATCTDKACGSDGCGGTCGTCGDNQTCQTGACVDLPPPTSCALQCGGQAPSGCWCDAECPAADCCADFCDQCGADYPGQCVNTPPNSCVGLCGSIDPNPDGDCYCDDTCQANNDCCPDFCPTCSAMYPQLCG